MKRALDIAKIVALLMLAAFLVALTLTILQLRENMDELTGSALGVVSRAVVVEQDLDDTINEARRSVQLTPKLINDARLTLDNANKAAIDERRYFEQEMPGLMMRVNATVDQLNATTHQAQGTLAAYQKTGETLTLAANGLLPVEWSAAKTLNDADVVLANPEVPKLLAHMDAAAAATASMAAHGDATAGEVQSAVHSWLHPGWKTRVTNWAITVSRALAGWL